MHISRTEEYFNQVLNNLFFALVVVVLSLSESIHNIAMHLAATIH